MKTRHTHSCQIIGVAVLGSLEALKRVIRSLSIHEVLISSPAIKGSVEARVREVCTALNVGGRGLHPHIK
jgi:FlaA1/EpsC-like NDP-sugar epimerase